MSEYPEFDESKPFYWKSNYPPITSYEEFAYKMRLIKAGMNIDDVMNNRKLWLNLDRRGENRGGPPPENLRPKDPQYETQKLDYGSDNIEADTLGGNTGYKYPSEATDFDYIRYEGKSYATNREDKVLVYLPMPAELNEQLEAGWTSQDNWLEASKNLGKSMKDMIKEEFTVGPGKKGLGEGLTDLVVGKFGGGGAIQKNRERTSGRVLNPVAAQFFSGMSHRTWEFMHKLVAESEKEATEINNLVNAIKIGSSVERKEAQPMFLKWPLVWDVKFMMPGGDNGKDRVNSHLPQLNKCAVTQVATNYSGAGSWARHVDGAPVEIDITISLTELTIPTAGNFGGREGTEKYGQLFPRKPPVGYRNS